MRESMGQKGELLLKESPFIWRDGQTLCCENRNPNCTHEQIEKMKEKRLLGAVDFCIIKIMAGYRYLALSHLNHCVNSSDLLENYKKTSYETNVSKLVRAGILNRYCFVCGLEDLLDTTPRHRSIHFYDLSRGAYGYARDVLGYQSHHMQYKVSEERILELLSLNQFDIGMRHHMKESIEYRIYSEKRKLGSSYAELDLYYRIRRSTTALPLHLYVISIRLHPGYEKRFQEKIKIIKFFMQKYTKIEPLIVLVTCENINAVKTLYQYQNMDEFLRDEVMLYTTDVSNYVFGSMNSIMLCKNIGEHIFLERLKLI